MSIAVEANPLVLETEPVELAVPSRLRLLISPGDFEVLCGYNRDLRLERTAQGELIAMSPAGYLSGWRELEIGVALAIWAKADKTGLASGSNSGFTLPNGAVRAPDASWIKLERWNALTEDEKERFAPIVPDFVVELCSPSDSRRDARAKLAEYIEQGARLGWLIDPKAMEVEIYRPGQAAETRSQPKTLSGEDVLPGFVLELDTIFNDRTAAAGGTDG